jgi:hypothetical protein
VPVVLNVGGYFEPPQPETQNTTSSDIKQQKDLLFISKYFELLNKLKTKARRKPLRLRRALQIIY